MAEQVNHNVVNNTESASASALAGVAANQTTTESAGNGTATQSPTTGNHPASAQAPDASAANVEATLANGTPGTAAPSAGEAATPVPDAPPKTELLNGVHELADSDGSMGVNSDTEKKDGHLHGRTSSVKKPTTFSKVSVTKNFMAKAASPVPSVAKIGDKPSALSTTPPAVNTAKPRLVAKTGALQSIQKARAGSESPGGPDASKVWNKNRPAAPQPAKQFTDEELKQQYGIHLATRLQSDENSKESKWADIDDEEEDWAPEAVVWMDGTKSTLTPAEDPPAQEPKPSTPQPSKPAENAKPGLAVKKPSESGPPRTILKPGIAAQQARQQSGAAAGGSSSEKPSLKAKNSTATPTKSPWAALPPVTAASPINPPVQQPPPPARLPTQDARAYEDAPAPLPAREIAADTFDRSWREGEGAPGELFNSASGRYEPAPEGRRSSMKQDGFRKPSLLQRPSHGGLPPAEPSPAFQSRSNSHMDGQGWQRRRGSSISQGSVPPGRRVSVSRHPDLPSALEDDRRGSMVAVHDVPASPTPARNEPVPSAVPQQPTGDQQMPQTAEPITEAEDPVKVQERIMHEKREEAIRRRKEEEERMEREKQERLKARLAALEGAGKSRKEREAEAAAAVSAAKTAASEKRGEQPGAVPRAEKRSGPLPKPSEGTPDAAPALERRSSSKASSQQQVTDEKLPSPLPPKPQQPAGVPDGSSSSADESQRQAHRPHLSPKASTRAPIGQQPSYRPAASYSSPGERKQQPYRSPLASSDAFHGWGSSAPNGNVWGTAGIGNGTFDKASSFAPVPMSQQTSLPPPPGMSRPSPSRISPQTFGQEAPSPSLQQQQISEQQRALPPPGMSSRADVGWGSARANGVSPTPGLGRQAYAPGPIAPPSRAQHQQPPQRPDSGSVWNSSTARLPREYAADAATAERKQQEPLTTPPHNETAKEGFRTQRVDGMEHAALDSQGSRSMSALSPAPAGGQTQPLGPVSATSPLNEAWKQPGENTVRIPESSLSPSHSGLPNKQPPIGPPSQQQAPIAAYQGAVHHATGPLLSVSATTKEEAPPPAELTSHPVNDGDVQHPKVRLPPPPPRVRLPPGPVQISPQMHQMPVLMPHQRVNAWGPPGAARPIAQTEDWQARFNGLFNRAPIHTEVPPSPPKTPPKAHGPALAVAASSRAAVDVHPPAASATVSLPQSIVKQNRTAEGFTIDDSTDVVSKPTIEQMFNEELSFGSLPKIGVPRNVMYEDDVYNDNKHNVPKPAPNSKPVKAVDAQTAVDMTSKDTLLYFFHKHPQGFFVKILGTKLNNKLVFAHTRNGKARAGGERKPSAKLAKGKDDANSPPKNSSPAPVSPAANSSTTAERSGRRSRRSKVQKTRNSSVKPS